MKTVIFSYDKAPPERVQTREKLAKELNAEIFIGGSDTVKNTFELLSQFEDDLLILEDDVSLCSDFKRLAQSVIAKFPEKVINFHFNTLPKAKQSDEINGLKIYETDGYEYIWNQCFYVPNDIRKLIISKYSEFCRKYPYYVRTKQQDVFIAECIRDLTFMAVYPSPVTHLDFNSTIRGSKAKQTIFKMS